MFMIHFENPCLKNSTIPQNKLGNYPLQSASVCNSSLVKQTVLARTTGSKIIIVIIFYKLFEFGFYKVLSFSVFNLKIRKI